jgi:SAM-dependent methyltransferase
MTSYLSDLNRRIWSTPRIANSYTKRVFALFPAEDAIFTMLRSELSQGRLLDIGIGAGRTTAQIKDRCTEYVGVDYSAEMIATARTRFQALDLRVMNACDLSAFGTDTFDAVIFSYNGIDYMVHADRMRALEEINRILRRRGVFIFSTHNRNCTVTHPLALTNLNLMDGLGRLPANIARYVLGILNSARMKKFERQEAEYALLNDEESVIVCSLIIFLWMPRSLSSKESPLKIPECSPWTEQKLLGPTGTVYRTICSIL